MSPQYSQHIIVVTINAYGHLRPDVGFACKAILSDPTLFCTVITPKFINPYAHKEVQGKALPEEAASRIRIVGVGQRDIGFGSRPEDVLEVPLREAYQAILDGQKTTCTATGDTLDYDGIPRPAAMFIDFGAMGVYPVVKELTPKMTLITVWPSTASNVLCSCGPPECFGAFENHAKIGLGPGMTPDEATLEFVRQQGLRVITTAEGLTVHGYELWPQEGFDGMWPIKAMVDTLQEAEDSVQASVIFTTRTFEPKSTQVIMDWWVGRLGKKSFFLGPQKAPTSYDPKNAAALPENFQPIIKFLDSQKQRSTLVIAWGTIIYPRQPWQIKTLYKTLLETRTPFIASKASAMYQPLDPELEKEIAESGIGMMVDYLPQRQVLTHPSVAAFLCHAGGNSLSESLFAGVLNIFWPFNADGPFHANYLTNKLDCSWELVQVRTGAGAGPLYRGATVEGTPEAMGAELRQVLHELRGEVGERKRKNLAGVRQQLLDAVADDGPCATEMQELLKWTASRSEATKGGAAKESSANEHVVNGHAVEGQTAKRH